MSFDDGDTWTPRPSTEGFETILPTNEGLIGLRSWRRSLHRFEGETWTEENIDSSVRIGGSARSPWGWYWITSHHGAFHWISEDSRNFRSMEAATDGVSIKRFVFGYAEASDRCPALDE